MKDMDIKRLIDKYLEGKTSPEEELRLAKALRRTDIPQEWQAIRLMLGELSLGEAEYGDIMAKRTKKPSAIVIAVRAVSAIAAILLLVFLYKYNNVQTETGSVQDNGKYAGATPTAVAAETHTQQTHQPEPTNVEQENLTGVVDKLHVNKRAITHVKFGNYTRVVDQHHVSSSEEVRESSVEEGQTNTETEVETHSRKDIPDMSDPLLIAAAQIQDIRSRGERLNQEVALLMEE